MRSWAILPMFALLLLGGCKQHRSAGSGAQPVPLSAQGLQADQSAAAAQQAKLVALQAPEMETDVPADVQRAIPAFKDALVKLTDDVVAGQPVAATAAQLQQALSAVLPSSAESHPAEQASSAKPDAANRQAAHPGEYGGEVKAQVTAPQPRTLLVDVSFAIECGDDHVLLGYQNDGSRWKRILRWQAPPYSKVSGAFGDIFEPLLLRPTRTGHPVLLVVHGTPWCTSTESSLAMDTMELDPKAETEKPFWHGQHGYRRADDVPPLVYSLRTTPDGFEIRASVNEWIGDAVARVGVMRYALVGNTMRRAFPTAMNVRESVSEWLSMPVEEARLFSDAQPGSGAWQMWDSLSYVDKTPEQASHVLAASYGDTRSCSDPKHYQVELHTRANTPGTQGSSAGPTYYVQMEQIADGYSVREAMPQPDPTCEGPVIAIDPSGHEASTSARP